MSLTETMGNTDGRKWFVMRDLKRRNSLSPAYKELADKGFEVFTPMQWVIRIFKGKKSRKEEPVIADLLFVHSDKATLDTAVNKMYNLQYRYKTGQTIQNPTTVRDNDMERFMNAVRQSKDTRYFKPGELGPDKYGKQITIVGGPFDGYSGKLLSLRGSKIKRLIVEIPDFIAAAVEVDPDYIQFV